MRVISALLALGCVVSLAAGSLTEQGIAAFSRGEYEVAASKLRDAVSADRNDPHAWVFLALTQAATGHCLEAVPVLTPAWESNGNKDLRRLAGLALVRCHAAAQSVEAAVTVAAGLASQFPDDADVLYELARVHMDAFNKATYSMFRKTPSSYRVNELSAEIFETQGRYGEAIAEYRRAIGKNPRALDLHYRLGRAILLDSHAPEALPRARAEFEAELQLNREDSAAEFQIGQILLAQNNPAGARLHFERALQWRSDFPEAALAVAKLEIQAKQYVTAIALLQRVVAAQPKNEAAHYNLMMAYRNAGMMDKARQEQQELERLQKPPEGEFTDFLKRLGEKPPAK